MTRYRQPWALYLLFSVMMVVVFLLPRPHYPFLGGEQVHMGVPDLSHVAAVYPLIWLSFVLPMLILGFFWWRWSR